MKLVVGITVAVAVVAGVLYLLLRSASQTMGGARSPHRRPRFKDFRYSGRTYEESQENYRSALREFNRQTGREWQE